MGILDDLRSKKTNVRINENSVVSEEQESHIIKALRGAPVGWSADLDRICALPRRELIFSEELADKWTLELRRDVDECDCKARWGYCLDRLNVTQAAALEEMHNAGGLLGIIGVGFGKTGISLLAPLVMKSQHAVLLIPPTIRKQLFDRDIDQWSVHFKIPNVAGHRVYYPDIASRLTVVAYSELSLAKNSDLLQRMPTDLIIADEAHNLKDKKSARTKRFFKAIGERPARFVALSGTMSSRSLKDYGHLAKQALGEGSPLPLAPHVLEEWAGAIDSGLFQTPAGQLKRLCRPLEEVRDGFGRRLIETAGVVATSSASVNCSLEINSIKVKVPRHVEELLQQVRDTAARPDGEEAIDAMKQAAWLRQIATGFYYRWIYPRGETPEAIDAWFDARKHYFKEVREKLKRSETFLDSPLNLAMAAIRWEEGYSHAGVTYPSRCKKGPLPVWQSAHWSRWRELRHTVKPSTEDVWESDFIIEAVAKWAKDNVGLIWVEHQCLGQAIALRLGLPYYGGGEMNPETEEDGSRCAVLSIKANKDGKNLQMYNKNLVVTPISSGKDWEQMIGRTHRQGQKADCVSVEVLIHTHEMAMAMAKAIEDARYLEATKHGPQKLCYASYGFLLSDYIDSKLQ